MSLASLPELAALDSTSEGVRIPPDDTVPLTPRVRALLDTEAMRRLARISQLGLVSLVYPGAVHSRLEHSLGVYRLALEFLRRLRSDPRFEPLVAPEDASAFVAAALVHDIGHWAYCHPIEDMGLPEVPRHEGLVEGLISAGSDRRTSSRTNGGSTPARIAALIAGTAGDAAGRVLHSLLSGPIDVDKMDYLSRDSLHAGVPYGRNFDQPRLLASLCLDERGNALAITDKGRTAAELMVFAALRDVQRGLLAPCRPGRDRHAAAGGLASSVRRSTRRVSSAATTRASPPGSCGPRRARRRGRWSPDCSARNAGSSSGSPRSTPSTSPTSTRRSRAAAMPAWSRSRRGSRSGCRAASAAGSTPTSLLIDAPPAEREVEFRLQVREREARHSADARPRWRRLEDALTRGSQPRSRTVRRSRQARADLRRARGGSGDRRLQRPRNARPGRRSGRPLTPGHRVIADRRRGVCPGR